MGNLKFKFENFARKRKKKGEEEEEYGWRILTKSIYIKCVSSCKEEDLIEKV